MLRLLWSLAFMTIPSVDCSSLYLETFHTGIWKVPEDVIHTLNVSLRLNSSQDANEYGFTKQLENAKSLLMVEVFVEGEWAVKFANRSSPFTADEVLKGVNKSLQFSGFYWGISRLSFFLTRNDFDPEFENMTLLRDDLEVVIDRGSIVLDTVFIAIGSVFLLFNNINMGAQLDMNIILAVLKRPLGPLCGFLSQFIIMPTITWIMGNVLFDNPLHKLGLFTYGCSPGGTGSNFWTLMFNGDINLSITMTIISTIAAMGMMPLWMFTLGASLLEENDDLQIPFTNLAVSLAALTIPISIGILIRIKRPHWAERGKRVLKPFSFFILIFFMVVGTINSYKVVLMMTWQMAAAGLFVMLCGYTLGALMARAMCLSKSQIIAVSIETALQNPGIAFILLKLSLESPYSDLASIPVIATLFMTGPPLIFVFVAYHVAWKYCGCCPEDSANQDTKTNATPMEENTETNKFLSDLGK
ncbi:hypothetical protein SK128_001017 [Halocaridina rubra]|uniref:Uncharacterized protein n=1 Tax=Halocaridina rubra TaxID=373956 RepID=A0AAN8WFS7_HALRR